MNASGQILGRVVEEGGAYAYIYQNGSVQRIPNLPDQPDGLSLTYNLPSAINNAGLVTG